MNTAKNKTANECLYEYGIDTGKMNDDFNTNLFMAMERYAEAYAANQPVPDNTTKPEASMQEVKGEVPQKYFDKAHDILERHSDLYCCTRVWEAWSVGTMTEDDFVPANNDTDIVADLAQELFAAVPALTLSDDVLLKLINWLRHNDKPFSHLIEMQKKYKQEVISSENILKEFLEKNNIKSDEEQKTFTVEDMKNIAWKFIGGGNQFGNPNYKKVIEEYIASLK